MLSNQDSPAKFEKLRKQAEKLIQQQPNFAAKTPSDILDLIHELKIHQAELEIQNEELKRAQHELSELYRKFENLYEFAPCGYVTLNAKGIVTCANLTAVSLLETTRQFLLQSGFSQYIVLEWNDAYQVARKKAAETGEKQSIELPLKKKSKAPLWVRVDIEADRNETGAVNQWLMVLIDITAQRKAEENKKRMEDKLRQAQKMESIGTLVGGIAHDFNNILYIITGNAELVIEDIPESNPMHANLKTIKTAGLRAASIVKRLLSFSRQTYQEFKPIGAINVIEEALKLMCSTIPASIEIRKHLPDTEVTIFGDPPQISQVMMNICTNASQAMEETGGILEITVEGETLKDDSINKYSDLTAGDYLKITIKDTGPGIDPKIIGNIFDPYFTTKGVGRGSGMGLAIVHGIVKIHHGAIAVESEPGKDATFTILFPVVAEKPVMEVKAPDEFPRGNAEKILFVDDEEFIVDMTGQMLERLGYKVETKTSPVEALELFQTKPHAFDLIITDMTMPQMSGTKLSDKLKEVRPDIPVIICTGHSSLIDEEKVRSMGIAGFIMKPIVMRDVAKVIKRVLDKTDEV